MTSYLNFKAVKEIPIMEFLAKLGHFPTHRSGKEIFYKSMLRDERTASLCINEHMGVWFDHGGENLSGIKGGDIIDLARAYWYPASFKEVIKKIMDTMSISVLTPSYESIPHINTDLKKNTRTPHYSILKVKDIGSNPIITKYLKSRGIWREAQDKIKEVYYSIDNFDRKRKNYFSAGWKNDLGNWELRSKIGNREFKACLGRKAISFIQNSPTTVAIFEGYLDFLSWLKDNPQNNASIIVLNSVNLLDNAMERIDSFHEILAYFDRDRAGSNAFLKLKANFGFAQDKSYVYKNYKDYNEMLMARLVQNHRLIEAPYANENFNKRKR